MNRRIFLTRLSQAFGALKLGLSEKPQEVVDPKWAALREKYGREKLVSLLFELGNLHKCFRLDNLGSVTNFEQLRLQDLIERRVFADEILKMDRILSADIARVVLENKEIFLGMINASELNPEQRSAAIQFLEGTQQEMQATLIEQAEIVHSNSLSLIEPHFKKFLSDNRFAHNPANGIIPEGVKVFGYGMNYNGGKITAHYRDKSGGKLNVSPIRWEFEVSKKSWYESPQYHMKRTQDVMRYFSTIFEGQFDRIIIHSVGKILLFPDYDKIPQMELKVRDGVGTPGVIISSMLEKYMEPKQISR